jgi:hypothetical protein
MQDVFHCLDVKDNNQKNRIFKIKTKEAKQNKQKHKFAKLMEWEAIAKKERSKQEGTYKSGQNMQGEQEEEEEPTKTAAVKRNQKEAVCCSCGSRGHCTNRSKACKNYVGKKARRDADGSYAAVADCGAPDPVEDMRMYDTLDLVPEDNNNANSDVEDVTLAVLLDGAATTGDEPSDNDRMVL